MKLNFLCSEVDKVCYRKLLYLEKLQASQGSHRVDAFFEERRFEIMQRLTEIHGEGFNYGLWRYEMDAIVNLKVKEDLWQDLLAYEERSKDDFSRRRFSESFFVLCGYVEPRGEGVISKELALRVVRNRLKGLLTYDESEDPSVTEFDFGWIFSFNSSTYIVGIHGQVVSVIEGASTEDAITQFKKIFR